MIRLMIVDDHPMVREGLEAMLMSEGGFSVVALAAAGDEAFDRYAETRPDIVLADVRMPRLDGFGLLEKLRAADRRAKVLLLAGMPLLEEEARARWSGAKGYLPKSVDQDRLTQVLRDIAAGARRFFSETFPSGPSILTEREQDVLRLVARGNQRDQIADALGIGSESVKTHLKGIMTKLGAPNAVGAVARAYELGILRA